MLCIFAVCISFWRGHYISSLHAEKMWAQLLLTILFLQTKRTWYLILMHFGCVVIMFPYCMCIINSLLRNTRETEGMWEDRERQREWTGRWGRERVNSRDRARKWGREGWREDSDRQGRREREGEHFWCLKEYESKQDSTTVSPNCFYRKGRVKSLNTVSRRPAMLPVAQ